MKHSELPKALDRLKATLMKQVSCEINSQRVDGQIIGTGKSDFTKDNVSYTLQLEGKAFQLIDVPGIEGEEARYTNLVRAAIAKSHLVVYVNGTNKKQGESVNVF